MTHVITQPCIGTKSADCVEVCPVDCIHEAEEQYFIDPKVCIDCGACVGVCPVDAIYAEAEVPADQTAFTAKNAQLAQGGGKTEAPQHGTQEPSTEEKPPEQADRADADAEEQSEPAQVLAEARKASAPPPKKEDRSKPEIAKNPSEAKPAKAPPVAEADRGTAKDPRTWDPTSILPMATHGESGGGSTSTPAAKPAPKPAPKPAQRPAAQSPPKGADHPGDAALEAAAKALEAAAEAVRAAARRPRPPQE